MGYRKLLLCCCVVCVVTNVLLGDSFDEHSGEIRIDIDKHAQEFYDHYIQRYYPKAFVIRESFFVGHKPVEIAGELKAFTDLVIEEPWFYISNKKEGFSLIYYWEFFLDQCSLIHSFLKKAYINAFDGLVYVPRGAAASFLYEQSYEENFMPLESLSDCLKRDYNDIFGEFYALSFDYAIKFFNEGILHKNMPQAERYYRDLQIIIEHLTQTPYEEQYHEAMQKVHDLLSLLRRQLGNDQAQMVRDLLAADNKGIFSFRECFYKKQGNQDV